jgi:hypothetical protein
MQLGAPFIADKGVSANYTIVPYKCEILITLWGSPRRVAQDSGIIIVLCHVLLVLFGGCAPV